MSTWIPIAERLPPTRKHVLIAYHNGTKPVVTTGWYCPAKTVESEYFEGEVNDEYDEERDTYYLKEQWADESQESEYHYTISNVTHWMEKPAHPDFA